MRHMPGAIQHRDARIRDALGEFIRISRRDDAVGFAPDDQGWRGDAVDVLFSGPCRVGDGGVAQLVRAAES